MTFETSCGWSHLQTTNAAPSSFLVAFRFCCRWPSHPGSGRGGGGGGSKEQTAAAVERLRPTTPVHHFQPGFFHVSVQLCSCWRVLRHKDTSVRRRYRLQTCRWRCDADTEIHHQREEDKEHEHRFSEKFEGKLLTFHFYFHVNWQKSTQMSSKVQIFQFPLWGTRSWRPRSVFTHSRVENHRATDTNKEK